MSIDELRRSLKDEHARHLDPQSPKPARLLAAKGVLPLPPRELVIVLAGLCLADDEEVAQAAAGTLGKLPAKVLEGALTAGLPPSALGALAPLLVAHEPLLLQLVLDKDTPDEVVAEVAAKAPAAVVEAIAGNQERCLRSSAIVHALAASEDLLCSSRDRLFDFLVRAGAIYEDLPEMAEAMTRLSPVELEQAAEKVALPPAASMLLQEDAEVDARAEAAARALEEKDEVKARIPTLKLINSLNVAQRVALAFKGNKEARTILMRDANRLVASATIRNPRITEQEVVAAAQSRTVCDEVVRIIGSSKDLLRAYGVKAALVNNPKTPLPTAMRLLTLLREADVRAVAKSKNVTAAVANQARRMLAQKK